MISQSCAIGSQRRKNKCGLVGTQGLTYNRYEGPSSDLVYAERGCSVENLPHQNVTAFGLIPEVTYSTKTVFCGTNNCNKNRESEYSTARAEMKHFSIYLAVFQLFRALF